MCSYNRVNGVYACENDYLLNQVLKQDWGFKGYVMSDWGAVHSTVPAANAGLDQQSGHAVRQVADYFGAPLKEAVAKRLGAAGAPGRHGAPRLRAMFASGVVDHPVAPAPKTIDFAAHAPVTAGCEEGMVLLKNDKQRAAAAEKAREADRRHRRPCGRRRAGRRRLLAGVSGRRQCGAGNRADQAGPARWCISRPRR
jgi:beta-glucosidase